MLIGMLNWIHTRTQKFLVLRRKSPSFKVLFWNCQSTFFANFWVRRKSLSLNYGKKPNYTEILILRLHARAKIGSISLQEATDLAMENYELAMVREESIVSISYFSWSLSVRGKKKIIMHLECWVKVSACANLPFRSILALWSHCVGKPFQRIQPSWPNADMNQFWWGNQSTRRLPSQFETDWNAA